jgi:hypothetical protein
LLDLISIKKLSYDLEKLIHELKKDINKINLQIALTISGISKSSLQGLTDLKDTTGIQ